MRWEDELHEEVEIMGEESVVEYLGIRVNHVKIFMDEIIRRAALEFQFSNSFKTTRYFTSKLNKPVTLSACIRQVSCLNFGRNIYSEWAFRGSPHCLQVNAGVGIMSWTMLQPHLHTFQVLRTWSFTWFDTK